MQLRRYGIFVLLLSCCFAGRAQSTKQLIDSAMFYKKNNYTKVISYASTAFKQANKEKKPLLAGQSAHIVGTGNYLAGNFNKALTWYFESEKIYAGIRDTAGLADVYSDMAVLYTKIKKFKQADSVSSKAVAYGMALKNIKLTANAVNNRGLMFLDEGKADSAIKAFRMSYSLSKKISDSMGMSYSLDYLSSSLSDKGQYPEALEAITESKNIAHGLGDKTGEAIATNNIGEIYLKQKMPEKAAAYFSDAIKMANGLKFLDLEAYAYHMLAQTYQQQGKYKDAYTAQSKYVELNVKEEEAKNTKALEDLQAKYETTKKEQNIVLLKEQNKVQQLVIGKKNWTLVIVAVMFAFLALIAYQQYAKYRAKQEVKLQATILQQQELATKGIIEAEERERKRIAGDLHDGVGQLFSTVKMNLEILIERFVIKGKDADKLAEKTMAMVDESCIEVRSIAHQMMPNALIKSGLVSALRDFINKIPSDKLKITIETKGLENGLESSTETVLYRVIQEAVNNVIKHAKASTLDILLLCDESEITVSIEDNGKGFIVTDKTKTAGIGLKNMVSRIEYLKGTVDISSSPGKGTLVAIYIPLS